MADWIDWFFSGAAATVTVAGVFAWFLLSEEDQPIMTLDQRCAAAAIEFAGLDACAKASNCQFSNGELADHYRARKEMLVYCASASMQALFREAEAMDGQPAQEEPTNEGT